MVKSVLRSMAGRWKHIGNALGLPQDVLDTIEHTVGMDHLEGLSQIVSKWLAQSEEFERPSWSRLVKAIVQCNVAGGDEISRTYTLSVSSGTITCMHGVIIVERFIVC